MDKINIFWIEDNPLFGTAKGTSSRLDDFKNRLPDGDNFSISIFQHPFEVREFLEMKNSLKDKWSTFSIECPQNIPDVVVFDYKLSEAYKPSNDNSLSYEETREYNLLRTMSANLKFKKAFPGLFTKDLFIELNRAQRIGNNIAFATSMEIDAGSLATLNDEFGLFCGLSIIREFKESITCGVPASVNKPDIGDLNVNSAFFEWVNKYDLDTALEKEDRSSKDLKGDVIPFAIRLLRQRILEQLSTGRITIDLNCIIILYDSFENENELNNIGNKTFKFNSSYGFRKLPLNGLFYGCRVEPEFVSVDKTKMVEGFSDKLEKQQQTLDEKKLRFENVRKEEIKGKLSDEIGEIERMIQKLETRKKLFIATSETQFHILVFLNNVLSVLQIESTVIGKVKRISEILWNGYLNDFEKRIELSDLHFRATINNETLTTENILIYNNHKTHFNVNDTNCIDEKKVVSIENFKKEDKTIIRLVVGYLISKFHITLAARMAQFGTRAIYSAPDNLDIYNVLNPVNNTGYDQNIIHPIHIYETQIPPKNEKKYGSAILDSFGKVLKDLGVGNTNSESYKPGIWMSPGEKNIIRSFFSNASEYYPDWLK